MRTSVGMIKAEIRAYVFIYLLNFCKAVKFYNLKLCKLEGKDLVIKNIFPT